MSESGRAKTLSKFKHPNTIEEGDKVMVIDSGLLMLQKFAPKNSRPNNVGWVEEVCEDGKTILVKFPIGDDDPREHSQVAPYPKELVKKNDW